MITAVILTPEGVQTTIIKAPVEDLDAIVAYLGEGYSWVQIPENYRVA